MKCEKCGMMLPDDSEFCQYCGSPITPSPISVQIETPSANKPLIEQEPAQSSPVEPNKDPVVVSKNSDFESVAENGHSADTHTAKEHKNTRAKRIVVVLIIAVSIIALAALNVIQYVSHRDLRKRLSEKDSSIAELTAANDDLSRINSEQRDTIQSQQATIDDQTTQLSAKDKEISQKNTKISSQESTISTQKNKISSLQTKADSYDSISSALKSGNIGYAASNFNCSQSIILVKKGETKKITLTANWTNGGTVSLSFSNYAASVDFDQNTWSYSTTLSIKGNSPGVSVVAFSK